MKAKVKYTHEADFRRERDFGAKIGATFEFVAAQFRPLFKCLAYFVLPGALLAGIGMGLFVNNMLAMVPKPGHAVNGPIRIARNYPYNMFAGTSFVGMGLAMVGLLVAFLLLSSTVYAFVRVRMATPPDEVVRPAQVWAFVWQRLGRVLGAWLLLSLVLVVGMGVLGGCLALLGPGFVVLLFFPLMWVVVCLTLYFPALWMEDDTAILGAPFMVMERLSGNVPADNPPYTIPPELLPPESGFDSWVYNATPEQQRTMWLDGIDVLAKIAKVDWRALGLTELDRTEFGTLGQEQLFNSQRRYYEFVTRKPVAAVEHGWKWLEANRPNDDHLFGFSWGDSRLGNLMFGDDFKIKAVFDWEMVRVCNPEFDLAWYLWFDKHFTEAIGLPRLAGFPSDEECIARWEAAVGRTAEHLEFYTVFTMVWFATIMARVMQSNEAHGTLDPAMADMETNNLATQMLAKHFGLAAPE